MKRSWSYDPKAGLVATVVQLPRSVMPQVVQRPEFGMFFGFHLMVFGAHQAGALPDTDQPLEVLSIDWTDLKIVSTITTLFLLFYAHQCYTRYQQLFVLTKRLLGCVQDFAYYARMFVSHSGQPHYRMACRWLVATALLAMCELRGEVSRNQWHRLVDLKLMKDEEMEFLSELSSHQRLLIMLHTAGEYSRLGLEMADEKHISRDAIGRLLTYRAVHQELLDLLSLPIPFEYFHLLVVMQVCTLLLLGYSIGLTNSCFAPMVYFLLLLTFLGIMDISSSLYDPFGQDAVDFPLNQWVVECLAGISALLDYKHEGEEEGWDAELKDEAKARTRLRLGQAEVDALLGDGTTNRWAVYEGAMSTFQAHTMEAAEAARVAMRAGYTQLSSVEEPRGGIFQHHVREEPGPARSSVLEHREEPAPARRSIIEHHGKESEELPHAIPRLSKVMPTGTHEEPSEPPPPPVQPHRAPQEPVHDEPKAAQTHEVPHEVHADPAQEPGREATVESQQSQPSSPKKRGHGRLVFQQEQAQAPPSAGPAA